MPTMLIDGDVMAHRACLKRDPPQNGSFDDYSHEENKEYLNSSLAIFERNFDQLKGRLFSDEYKIAVKGINNFRLNIDPTYKAHRTNNRCRNPTVKMIRDYMVGMYGAVEAHGQEADDLLRIWAEEMRRVGEDFIIVSIDKDLLCIPGMHYRIGRDEILEVSEFDGMRLFYEQLLKGDPTDNVKGVPKIGDKTAAKLLSDITNEDEAQRVVVREYQKAFGLDWAEALLLNGLMLFIRKDPDEFFSIDGWEVVKEYRNVTSK